MEWVWDSRSARLSSKRMKGAYGRQAVSAPALSFSSRCRCSPGVRMSHDPPSRKAANAAIVFVVDDDASVRDALSSLFRSVGLQVELFGSAPEFLQRKLPDVASCLVLDIRLPGVSGLEFQSQLAKPKNQIPIIFMTAHGDIPMSVRASNAWHTV